MSDPRPAPRQLLLPALILALLLAVLWGWLIPRATEAVTGPPGFDTWDFHNYFLPRYVFGTQELLAGRLPLWNRLEFAGMPFLATLQPAALYPPKILAFALFGPESAMKMFLIAHAVLLLGGFLLFMRSQGIGALGTLAGGAYLAFNTTSLMADYHPFRIANFAWLPLMFWLADRVAKTQRRASVAALALAVAMQLLVGYPEFTLHAALLLGVQAIVMWAIGAWPAPPWRVLPCLAVAFVLGAMLAGLQLAPFVELAGESQRSASAQAFAEQARVTLTNSNSFLELAKPAVSLLGGLSAFGLASLPWRRSLPAFASVSFVGLMGWHGWRLLRKLPLLSGIRHGFMWIVTAQFAVAWLVALGADSFGRLSGARARDRFSTWTVGGLAALWCILCLLALILTPAAATVESAAAVRTLATGQWIAPGGHGSFDSFASQLASSVVGGAVAKGLGAIGASLIVAAAFLVRATPRRDSLAIAGVTLVALGQIAAYPINAGGGPFRPIDPGERLGNLRPNSAEPIEGRVFSFEDLRWGYTFFDHSESLFGLETSLPPSRFRALQQRLGFEANWYRLDWQTFGKAEGFLDALDVEYVAAPWLVAAALPEIQWERAPQNPSYTALLRNRERPGRAWVVYGAAVAPDAEAALERLLSPGFDPRREVILEAPLASLGGAPANDPATPARVGVMSPTRVEVEAELPRPGLLVLSEAWFPGWVASVDGAPAEILRADYVLRGVALGAGSHRVRFDYRPRSVRIGAGLTLLGVCGVLGLVVIDRRGREVGS
jgi:hypothetical protein